jgi:PAS domain S-box-containing protein
MVVADARGQIQFVNLQAENLFGYQGSELIGRSIEVLIPERFHGAHVGHRTKYVNEPSFRPMGSGRDLFGRRKDGTEIAIEVSLSPLRTTAGVVVSAAIRDTSERKRLQAAENLAADRLRSAVENSQEAFGLFDADDRLILSNGAFLRMLPPSLQDANGRRFSEILDATLEYARPSSESVDEHRVRRLAYRAAPHGAFDFRTEDGRSLRVTDRRTAEGGTVTTIWDLTEDVQRETDVREARAAAEAASAAKSEFLSAMSHELRTPLNAILGFAQLLQRDTKEPLSPRLLGMVGHIMKGGEHLLRLIDEVLDLSRIEAGGVALSPEPVSVPEVLEEVKTTLAPMAARAKVELRIANVPAHLPFVIADRTRFAQILMNFGSNAIKYGSAGSSATFVATPEESYVRVSVVDTGIGIPADKQPKLFQPFHRAGQETGPIEGTGIGLTISKRLAEMMGGRVGFRSEKGNGSEFWVELPARLARLSRPPTPPQWRIAATSPIAAKTGLSHKIIYIEDNPSNVAFMVAFLGAFEQIELMTAPTAEIGIELVRTHRPAVVIMDINLPGMSGLQAMAQLRDWPETRDIPVIALSAAAMSRDRQRGQESGFVQYLTKPVKVDELTSLLETLLSGGVDRAASRGGLSTAEDS